MAKKRQVGNIKLVPRSVSNNTPEPRMTLSNQVCSPSLMLLYHSNWSDDLYPPYVIPSSPLNGHQSWLGVGHLGTTNSMAGASLNCP